MAALGLQGLTEEEPAFGVIRVSLDELTAECFLVFA